MTSTNTLHKRLAAGLAIPALPLALDAQRRFDPFHQRAVLRYYLDAGVSGIAVGVHSTQFAIRDPAIALYEPLLRFAATEIRSWSARRGLDPLLIAGVCGETAQAQRESTFAKEQGYDAALLSLVALGDAQEDRLIAHATAIAKVLPVIGFYLQRDVGGRVLPLSFWRRFAAIPGVVAIKIAPFNRYRTLDVVRAVSESPRADEVVLYTGNDDTIVTDLLTPFRFSPEARPVHIRGGLLGHWGVWTRRAVELLAEIHHLRDTAAPIPPEMLQRGMQITDMNAAVFDSANDFAGCIPGIHEILRRNGLLAGTWCLDPQEQLSPGQAGELDRVSRSYPHLVDDAWIAERLSVWLKE